MKWYNSLITKITLIFTLALIGVVAVLYIIHIQIKEIETENIQRFAKVILQNSYQNNKIDIKALQEAGFTLVKDSSLKQIILENKRFTPPIRHMRNQYNNQKSRFKVIEHNRDFFLSIGRNLVFRTPHEKDIFPKIIFPISAVLFIIFLYIATIRSILPLYDLRQKVKEFADGNYNIDCKSNKKDEIGILSNEFDKSVKKIKKLRDSRQLFLRNIMHELKTPITKGKLSCEMIEESNYQNILKNVFRRQETLLNEFARIEKLSANELNINTQEYSLQDIVDFSFDILNHEKENVTCKLTPMTIQADFELFATALKNLLDNGINYSDDKHVTMESNTKQIIISNSGKELEFPLQNYAEPYFLDSKKAKSSRGLGFGLFITLNIFRLHNVNIQYKRQKNKNLFIINLNKN